MFKPLFLVLSAIFFVQICAAQKKYINRKVAQKNYDGYMLMQESKYDSALILFNHAINADAEAFFIYQNRAICKMHLKDTLGAINDYKTNIKLEPDNTESKYALGNIYKNKKDSLNAVTYFAAAIKQADDEFSQKKLLYMNNFCGHYFRLHEDFDSALVYYNQVKRYTPKNASVFINSAVCNFGLDSIGKFCNDLEQAFILGGSVNCIALKAYCKGCNHLVSSRGNTDTLSTSLDTRLAGIIPDTIYHHAFQPTAVTGFQEEISKKIKVYYNSLWQICLPENAKYYRESFWAELGNFYGGNFTDYYINGKIYATGRTERGKVTGSYKVYYPNEQLKLKAQFIKGSPTGKWTFYLEDGTPDYEVEFFMDEFTLKIVNKNNPNYAINSGTGKFRIVFDKWDKIEFVFSGEYLNNEREGNWNFKQAGTKIISENYKKGKFKRGYFTGAFGAVSSSASNIDATIFIPPHISQVRNLFFDLNSTVAHYSFIRTR